MCDLGFFFVLFCNGYSIVPLLLLKKIISSLLNLSKISWSYLYLFLGYLLCFINLLVYQALQSWFCCCSVSKTCPTLCDPWTTAIQAFPRFTISQSLLKLMSIESVILSNHLILCQPLLLLPSIFPSIRVFSNESVLCIRWP